MAAYQGSQLVNILSAPTKDSPNAQEPFPPIGQITTNNPFPNISPSPQYLLVSQDIQAAWALSSQQLADFPTGQSVVQVRYWRGNQHDSGFIITTATLSAIQSAF